MINIEENSLNCDFTAEAPNQKRCTGVTFLQYDLAPLEKRDKAVEKNHL
ncbi:hypothetical protein [Streptococcus mutans]|nr:hypothetical protein [Streptococcus mutans]MCB4944136.1 hypothetical protein [Streptococcus mutans]MCB4952765.1 hypothetical protein [Streptococcus mutans]MCB4955373.1 hypothetical protein [Streptococcus mutans]MCB4961702.1 hypothetical protein [Streptococcus mutans]MCB4964953.1 hypothetical protein [Streptococcus mutans]